MINVGGQTDWGQLIAAGLQVGAKVAGRDDWAKTIGDVATSSGLYEPRGTSRGRVVAAARERMRRSGGVLPRSMRRVSRTGRDAVQAVKAAGITPQRKGRRKKKKKRAARGAGQKGLGNALPLLALFALARK